MRSYIINNAVIFGSLIALLLIGTEQARAYSSCSDQPSVVRAVIPLFPGIVASAHIEGTVIIEVQIDERGAVTSTNIIEGPTLLRKNAEIAARRWTFTAPDNLTNKRSARLSFTFKIMPKDSPHAELLSTFLCPYHVEIRLTIPDILNTPNAAQLSPVKRPKSRKKIHH